MYSFDSLTLKYFFIENADFIQNSIVQKIQLPSRYEIIFSIRNLKESKNKKLYININPKYPHICFLNDETYQKRDLKIPTSPPMFCMQLRKYLNGSKIKDFKLVEYERILELYFDYFDEIGSLTRICLAVELMGKHSNIILYNAQNKVIIGSIHNISAEKSSIREIYGGISYIYPPQKQKLDILNSSFSTFCEIAKDNDIVKVSNNFYYFNQAILNSVFEKYHDKKEIFDFLQKLQNGENFEFIKKFWSNKETVNDSIDDYFSKIMFDEILNSKKVKLRKYLHKDLKKIQAILKNKPDDLKAQNYKLKADLLMAYMYSVQNYDKKIVLDDVEIEVDETISLNDNAQKYYSLYKKSKTSYEHSFSRYKEALDKYNYFDEIIFAIDNSNTFSQLEEIKDELIEIGLINEKKASKNISPIEKIEFKGFEIYIGKNNKQNDYLISKLAKGEDLWFHGLNFPSSHIILKVPNDSNAPDREVLEFCAQLVKDNSKAKNSGKTSIIMTQRKNLKKPPNTYLGYVTYKNEVEIVI